MEKGRILSDPPLKFDMFKLLFLEIREIALGKVGLCSLPARILLEDTLGENDLALRDLEETAARSLVTVHKLMVALELVDAGILLVLDRITFLILHDFRYITPTAEVVPADCFEAEFVAALLLEGIK